MRMKKEESEDVRMKKVMMSRSDVQWEKRVMKVKLSMRKHGGNNVDNHDPDDRNQK